MLVSRWILWNWRASREYIGYLPVIFNNFCAIQAWTWLRNAIWQRLSTWILDRFSKFNFVTNSTELRTLELVCNVWWLLRNVILFFNTIDYSTNCLKKLFSTATHRLSIVFWLVYDKIWVIIANLMNFTISVNFSYENNIIFDRWRGSDRNICSSTFTSYWS